MKTVLYIDDDCHLVELYGVLLESEGLDVWTALSAESALQTLAEKGSPDLLIVDFSMPKINGVGFLETAKSRFPGLSDSYILGMTGFEPTSKAVEAFCRLSDEVVGKPFDVDEFLDLIRRVLASPHSKLNHHSAAAHTL